MKKRSKRKRQPPSFSLDERVEIAKTSRVVDTERKCEGEGDLPPIRQDMTGATGHVCSTPYRSERHGEDCYPLRLAHADGTPNPKGPIVSVPAGRLRRDRVGIVTRWSRKFSDGWDRIFGTGDRGAAQADAGEAEAEA